ncbi:hypothetical protein CYMTET_13353, partial [Cymbomonas tetramitiformis]
MDHISEAVESGFTRNEETMHPGNADQTDGMDVGDLPPVSGVLPEGDTEATDAIPSSTKPPTKGEVFVGGLDPSTTEEDLLAVFSAVGDVLEVHISKDVLSGDPIGFAFVTFADHEVAELAAHELNRTEVCGTKVGVLLADENATLFLGLLNKEWSEVLRRPCEAQATHQCISAFGRTRGASVGCTVHTG